MAGRINGSSGTLHLTDASSARQFVADTQNITISESTSTEQLSVHGTNGAITTAGEDTYEVTFDGLYSTEDVGQVELKKGVDIEWIWYITADQTATGPSHSGTFVISSIERSQPADGKVTFSISASGSGELIHTNSW